MRAFFDGLDAADTPVPRDERIAAALGPKMLDFAAERSLGTHPYFTTPEHTRFARERVGPDALVAPELAVVVETDPERAREDARAYAATYLGLTNYTSNLLRFGFTEADIADGGSDRLIDAVIPHGSAEEIAEAVQAHFDAGADHVCLQPLGHGPAPVEDYRALAEVAALAALRVEPLQQLVGGELDRLVAPLGGAVHAGDQPHAVDAAEVAVDERVARLRLVVRALGEPEVPLGVLVPRVRLQERVLLVRARLHVAPVAVEHVLAGVDQLLCALHGALVEGVGGHQGPAIIQPSRSSRSPGTPAASAG